MSVAAIRPKRLGGALMIYERPILLAAALVVGFWLVCYGAIAAGALSVR